MSFRCIIYYDKKRCWLIESRITENRLNGTIPGSQERLKLQPKEKENNDEKRNPETVNGIPAEKAEMIVAKVSIMGAKSGTGWGTAGTAEVKMAAGNSAVRPQLGRTPIKQTRNYLNNTKKNGQNAESRLFTDVRNRKKQQWLSTSIYRRLLPAWE